MSKLNYVNMRVVRDDIQGVRVVGALLVFAFHVFFNGVSGGVDVFFVVSGYFMAKNFIKNDGVGRRFPIINFYQDFLIRIAPQAIVAILGILLLVALVGSPMAWTANLRDIAASALYIENWWLINRGNDYLARSESLSLIQHFWAVALIGQSYLLWPWIVEGARWVAGKAKREPRVTLVAVIGGLSLLSFAWSLYSTHATPTSAYFDFFARFWEFGCGVMLGLLNREGAETDRRHAALLSWCGLILLVTCGAMIGTRLSFPGFASLWPVAAALLIIRYGRPSDRFNAGWLLSRRPIAVLAGISFGVYLWHWPLYALYQDSSPGEATTLLAGLAILVMSGVLAWLSKGAVDVVLRRAVGSYSKVSIASAFCVILLTISFSSEAVRRHILKSGPAWDRQSVSNEGFIAPGPFTIRGDNAPVYKLGCHQNITSTEVKSCSFGKVDAPRTVVVVGGSHSAQWLPALLMHAGSENWKIVSMTKSGCLFADPLDKDIFARIDTSCQAWNTKAISQIMEIRPDLVLSIATRVKSKGTKVREYIPAGYISFFQKLSDKGINVLAIRDNPWMHKDVPRCIYSPVVMNKADCGGKRSSLLDDNGFAESKRLVTGSVRILDLTDQFCNQSDCWAVKDDLAVYRDNHHISATYAEKISPLLRDAINRVWNEQKGQ